MAPPTVTAVDLFCGAGGLAHGLGQAGIRVRAGYDLDEACRHAYTTNNGGEFHGMDVANVQSVALARHFDGDFSLLAGCAPCQPFSIMNAKRLQSSDDRWPLLQEFARLAKDALPDFVTMENVPGLRGTPVFQSFLDVLHKAGYQTKDAVIDCSTIGVPQRRHRLVLVGSRHGEAQLPPPRRGRKPTVRGAIGALPKVAAGEEHERDALHRAPKLSPKNIQRIKASKPGGTWRDWPDQLRLDCHRQASGSSYSESYGRMAWDQPAPTVTTKFFNLGSGRFGHPEQDRALTLREGALLQTFPRSYSFMDEDHPLLQSEVGRLIGNAVPVALGRAVGDCVVAMAAEA